ncbi:hypothetical protein [Streptomyces sp. NPDC037389]
MPQALVLVAFPAAAVILRLAGHMPVRDVAILSAHPAPSASPSCWPPA